jgi:transposase
VLRLLTDRHHDLTGLRTQAICRLHALLCGLTPGGAGRLLSAQRAGRILRSIHPGEPVEVEGKRIALELAGDVRRFDSQLVAINERIVEAVLASGTTVTDIHGIGPLGAAIILGHTGDISRFPTSGHYARYTGSAPIAASSGPKQRHRLNPRGNRQLNRALHVAAVTQVRNDTPRPCLLPAQARRAQDPQGSATGPQTPDRQDRLPAPGRRRSPLRPGEPGRAGGTTRSPARPALHPETGSSDKPLPDPTTTLRPPPTGRFIALSNTPLDTKQASLWSDLAGQSGQTGCQQLAPTRNVATT